MSTGFLDMMCWHPARATASGFSIFVPTTLQCCCSLPSANDKKAQTRLRGASAKDMRARLLITTIETIVYQNSRYRLYIDKGRQE